MSSEEKAHYYSTKNFLCCDPFNKNQHKNVSSTRPISEKNLNILQNLGHTWITIKMRLCETCYRDVLQPKPQQNAQKSPENSSQTETTPSTSGSYIKKFMVEEMIKFIESLGIKVTEKPARLEPSNVNYRPELLQNLYDESLKKFNSMFPNEVKKQDGKDLNAILDNMKREVDTTSSPREIANILQFLPQNWSVKNIKEKFDGLVTDYDVHLGLEKGSGTL